MPPFSNIQDFFFWVQAAHLAELRTLAQDILYLGRLVIWPSSADEIQGAMS